MAQVAFPARCAVAVVCGDHLVSQVYPAAVPVEVFIDDAIELLNDDLRRRGADGLDPGPGYELHRANGSRLDITKTLDELGVEDGATLMLVPAEEGESFEPQYESLSTGLARIGKRLFPPVTAETAAVTAIAVLAMAVLTVLGLAVRLRMVSQTWEPAVATGLLGGAVAFGAVSVRRWFPGRDRLLDGLAWLAVPLLSVALAAAAPGPVGAPHAFIAMLAFAAFVVGIVAATRRHVGVAALAVTLCGGGVLVSAVRMFIPVPSQWLGMITLIGLLVLVTAAPTLALRAARLRPPHFGSITGNDLFQRSDGMPVDAVAPVDDDEPNRDTTPSGPGIADAAKRANAVLTGICAAAAVTLPFAVWATLMPGGERGTAAAVLAVLFVVIFISRARAFADRRQAVALVCGAASAVCVGVVRYVAAAHIGQGAALIWGAATLAGFSATALAAGLVVPSTRFTPLVRMVTEWIELAAIVAALPLAAWIGGLFNWVRMR